MALIRPFRGLRPDPKYTEQVIAPPYDVVSAEEARSRAAGKPYSFLHVSRPEIDLPPDTDPYSPPVYAKGKENFENQINRGILVRDPEPYYYLYRLVMGSHTQMGWVAVASVAAYRSGRIKKHEFTRPDKEDDRVRQIDALNAQTGPVFLTYRHSEGIDRAAAAVTAGPPDVDVTADDGVRHSLWVVRGADAIARISREFETLDGLYIADGHHRSAAASRVADLRRESNPAHSGEEPYNYFLSVIFPDNQMQILPYNRVIRDLNGLSATEFLRKLEDCFDMKVQDRPYQPSQGGEFGLYLSGKWYRLILYPEWIPADDPVGRLDVSLLTDRVIAPILGIADTRRDKRIDFVGGIRGLEALERRVDSGEMAVAFSMFATTLSDLMAVADAGEVMPPKSTWFEPKLADGMVSHVLD
jgi:uncharacterized protein (DUF1015 family)